MATDSARTLFTVTARAERHGLLSIRQRDNGDVSILVPSGDPTRETERIAGHRLHVLAQGDPGGILLSSDHALPDGRRRRSTLRLRWRRRSILFPLFSVRYPDPAGRTPCNDPSSGQDVDIAAYDPALSVLVFHVVLSGRDQTLDGLSDFNVASADVGTVRISILWGFMRAPSLAEGGVRGVGLPIARDGPPDHPEQISATRKSLSAAELSTELRHARSAFSVDQIAALRALFAGADVAPDPRFEEIALHYARTPLA